MAKLTCSPRDSLGPSRVVINLTPMKTEMVFDCNVGSHLDTHVHVHKHTTDTHTHTHPLQSFYEYTKTPILPQIN